MINIVCRGWHSTDPGKAPSTTSDVAVQEGWRQTRYILFCMYAECPPAWLCPECVKRLKEFLYEKRGHETHDIVREYTQEMGKLRRKFQENIMDLGTAETRVFADVRARFEEHLKELD